jgi:hypothetical protein
VNLASAGARALPKGCIASASRSRRPGYILSHGNAVGAN